MQLQPRKVIGTLPQATLLTWRAQSSNTVDIVEAPLFHFRKWSDYGDWNALSAEEHRVEVLACFVIKTTGFSVGMR